jgi:dienelactone hydrolase
MPAIRSVCLTLLAASACFAQIDSFYSVPGPDAPELAPRGKYSVGVRTLDLVHKGQVDILHFDKATGKAPLYDRPLKIEVWYPATIPTGKVEETVYDGPVPGSKITGKALRDAPTVDGEKFPLVIVSHGYPGSRTFLSYLCENLASKGYVVAAIDHTDSVFGDVREFASTLLNRAADQIFALDELSRNTQVDASRAAIIGYSMGGFGALASAGAAYSAHGAANQFVPGGYFAARTADSLHRDSVKALVAIAPWGAQPPINSWDAAGFAGIRAPSLFIAGDRDDVSDYASGIKPAFEGAVNSNRCMLVYENALHNVGGNPAPAGVALDFSGWERFEEPVWRKERIMAVNEHFITAFLDLYLKGDESRRRFLSLPFEKSNDGKWPLARGEQAGAKFSEQMGKEGSYWYGFQRRWALGLEMRCLTAR